MPFIYEGDLVEAETIFGISSFKSFNQDVICQCISQSNFKINQQDKFAKLGVTESFNWVKTLQNFAQHYDMSLI